MNFWDERFNTEEYVYGKEANAFLRSQLSSLPAGKILFPGEGEGRNAVYAAGLSWDVHAFDGSKAGQIKALSLASERGLSIQYELNSYQEFQSDERYDAIGLFFTHLPAEHRSEVHRKYLNLLKPGGRIILQAFRKEQLGLNSGGPKDLNMLFSREELLADFQSASSLSIDEVEEELDEGPFHQGKGMLLNAIIIK